ncbi:MAG: choice-of-anchor L domain-containing protein, partial [Flavobacteriaceae bacterium]
MNKNIFFFILFSLLVCDLSSQNQPPVITSEGNSTYCPQTSQDIVTFFNIEDPDDTTLDALYIQISEGYAPGEDQLFYNGSNPDLNTTWSFSEGKLEIASLTGEDLPINDIIDAVYEVTFSSTNPNPSDKSFSFTIGNANYLPSTGHYYIYFEQTGITWIQARQAAENSNYYGLQGYLATILSEEENQISAEQAGGAGWIGASDQDIEGEWNWVTGPEGLENGGNGIQFWLGEGAPTGGGPVNGMYSNWNNDPAEPNQSGNEDYAHITDDSVGLVGSWNDLSNTGANNGPYQPKGYVVEYGGMPGDPELNLSSSTTLLAPPIIAIEPFVGNDCSLISLNATSENGDGSVFWFEEENGGDHIFYGSNYELSLEPGNYSYWVSPFQNGECDSYNRIELPVVVSSGMPEIVNPNVTVDQECFTVEELVTDVLINNPCANVSNITWSSGNDFGVVNGIGHFLEPSGGFPFSEGIILSSGNALDGSGPNGGASTGGFEWPGDSDLDGLIDGETNNASIIEFDFVPISNELSFRFIMASEEYNGNYECTYSDVFAFLLTDQNGVTTNLAVLPDTDTPITITNIRPDTGSCEAVNPEYFHGYIPQGEPDIGYDGRTIPLIAKADVNIGETYHIKLAVADALDDILDSAVFLEAGSFDLGVNLGEDILIGSGDEECIGGEVILNTQIDDTSLEVSFDWFKDGAILDDENSSTLVVSETGTYSVDVIIGDDCNTADEILVEFYIPEEVENLVTLNACDNFDVDGDGVFNLNEQNSNILDQLTSDEFTITYYESEEDAINDVDSIENPDSFDNTIPFSQEIFTRIVPDSNPTCFSISSFLIETIGPPDVIIPEALEECDDDYDGFVDYFDLSEKTDEILDGQTGITVSYHETIEEAENNESPIIGLYTNIVEDGQIIHVRLEDDESGCSATTTLELIVNPIPEIITPPTLEVCDANYDGITTIDLSSLDTTILNGQTGISVTYYETQEDADNATNVLPIEYQNSNPNTQELVVRLENDVTGCYSTTVQGIIVNVPGIIEVTDYELCDYTDSGDLQEIFDITTKDDEIINGQNVSLSYFTSFNDSQNNINALTNAELVAYENTTGVSEAIFIRLEQNETGCLSFGSFNVTVNPLPNVIENTDLVQCDIDDVQDGISIYNLEEAAENLVIGDDPNNYVLTFHLSEEDLEAGINAIEDPTAYVNLTPLQNIYCRVENINTTCYTTSYFYLETIFNPIPEDAGLIVCDNSEGNGNDYDGLGLFTLSDADEYVLSLIVANPNNDITDASQLSIAYYANEEDALLELNQLPNEYISEVPDAQTVYLRVERDNDCFGINSMMLQVLPVPQYNEVPDEILCTDTPGVIDVDLTEYDTQVLGSQDPNLYIVTYHSSQLDADTGFNALESPYTVNDQETIFTRVEVDNNNPFEAGCFISNINFTLTVEPKPVFAAPTPLIVCDDDDIDGITAIDISVKTEGIMAGIVENVVTYHETEEDMNAGVNAIENITAYTNTENPQTLYVRIEDDMTEVTGCYSDTTLELIVQIPPPVSNPPALEYCDADADGFGVFNLTDSDEAIANGLPNLLISYHETQADAENNLFPIIEEYDNIVAYQQTIYVRVEDTTITTDCFSYVELLLIVNDVPQINTESSSIEVCDDDTDGFGLFDLSLSNEEVLNGLDPSDFDITYYETPENAENAENPIITPFAYTNVTAFNQTVWVRVENNTTLCYNTSSIELIVNELPVLTQPDPLNLCDYNNPGDEVEEFTLEDSIGQVLQGQTGIGITFYESQEDADNATNPIVSPYTNTSNAQTIYLRGENEITGCYSTITLDLRVNPIPSPVVPEPIEECDEDNDGFTFFTVEDNEVDIINGELDIVLSYYETTTNAENAIDPIISPYYNIVPDSQIIFVRAENVVTGCFTIVEQELVTIPSPELPIIIEDIVVCDDDYDGITVFDLTQRDEDIFGEQSTTDFGLTYHETLIDAETGENPIVNTTSYENLTNPQTIFVRLEDLNNGCVSIGEFNLIVALPPVIVQPTALEECDDEIADETTEFDLTVKNDEITAGNLDWEVIYYETEEDALAGTNAIETPEAYTNTAIAGNAANPQTLHVAVVNIEGCIAYTTLTIRVLPNPTPSTDPQDIGLCDYDNPGDQIEVFDITINEAYIINGEPGVSAAYYESLENATDEIDPIADPTAYTNIELGQQAIYVRVTNDTTGCFTIVTFDIIVNPLPDIGDVPDVVACEIETDGFYDFDLEAVTAELLNPQDPANFTVTYHETQEDADNGENALVSPYTNLTNPQQLFVNITNNLTGCNITGAGFNIVVQEAAIANGDGVPAELIICDDPNTANDGFAEFNLTNLDAQILDGQDPVNFTVTYYATIEDAETFTNALPVNFENTSNPQTIFARVDNDTTVDDQCYDITDATLLVNLLPEFTLEDSYMACVDVNGTELIGPTVMLIDLPDNQYTFEWINPAGDLEAITAAHTPLMGGIYTAVATDILTGCRREVTTEVIPSSPAIVEAVVTTLAFAEEHVIEANAVGSGDYEYSLDDGPWQLNGTFTDVSPGEHIITVRDLNGCGIGTKSVLVIDYPRFFTPNGDGYNDTWQIIGIDTRPLSTIYIFDRYGKLLKQLSPLSEGWDGTFNGKPLPATDYWFTVKYEEPGTEIIKTFRAHFSL